MAYAQLNYSGEFYPPPYNFVIGASGPNSKAGGCGCGGTCGGCGGHSHGMGLFDSGMDYTQWGAGEWVAVAFGVYIVTKVMGDVGRVSSGVRRTVRRRRSKSRRKSELTKELSEL